MSKYIIRRILLMIPILLGVSLIVFSLMHLTPGDPVQIMLGDFAQPAQIEVMRDNLGLNDPIHIQYFNFVRNSLQGNFGRSIHYNEPVINLIKARVGFTINLSLAGFIVSYLIAFPAGIISAIKRNTFIDDFSMVFALIGISMPNFWLGMMLMLVFALRFRVLPATGVGTWRHLVLPAITVGTAGAALATRLIRSSMLEVINKDYIRTARAKGLMERTVTFKHALKNAILPVLTIIGLRLGFILSGSVITEIVFARPGLGRLMVDSIFRRDYLVVQASVLLVAVTVLIANLIIDLVYGFIDPQIRYD
ncbi:ABC transporter permease [Halanaerobiaceae bacterium Z-7014]|uniref:Nickel import system permease protein NikB n=1 Tax=Halonatronomonas betaini TaxID=2778430 RepID=A0A931AVD7_9FIRM|nr:nickel ABC transporter permease [Halonatronomonas betaini]MBF8437379.1 ABC transporter permease [Halonatronomonas betaini]